MPPVVPSLITSGKIAEQLGVPLHRVVRILATRPHIRPSARAGMLRLYSADAVEAVRVELENPTNRNLHLRLVAGGAA